jgi:hypothetical protein
MVTLLIGRSLKGLEGLYLQDRLLENGGLDDKTDNPILPPV